MGDFEALLSMATKTHEKTTSQPSAFKSTQIVAAKKDPKAKKLSDNVKKFLDRRKADEDAKRKEADRKRHELQKMRAESRESQKVVKRMVTKNKAVNYSVIPEAVNEKDTADTLAGRNQCDEDDYGYESTMARNLYEKLMSKYEANPEDPMAKFTKSRPKTSVKDPNSTIARVKEALSKGDEPLPKFTDRNRKKGKGKAEDDFINDGPIVIGESVRRKENSQEKNECDKRLQEEKKKKRKPLEAASFEELLKMASKVKSIPSINTPEKVARDKEKEPEFRPMTKKQKEEYERQKQSELRKAGKISSEKVPNSHRIPIKKTLHASTKSSENKANSQHISDNKLYQSHNQNGFSSKPHSSTSGNGTKNTVNVKEQSASKISTGSVSSKTSLDKRNYENNNGRCSASNALTSKSTKTKEQQKVTSKVNSSGMQKPESVINRIKSAEAREFPGEKRPSKNISRGKRPRSRSRSISPVPLKSKKVSGMRIESDSEYDSEMDDFIDDSDAKIDISAEIRNIFGYDRRKFKDEDDFDDRSMETNRFSDIMKEEARSAKIGRLEDLEDMRREEERKKRKLLKKYQR